MYMLNNSKMMILTDTRRTTKCNPSTSGIAIPFSIKQKQNIKRPFHEYYRVVDEHAFYTLFFILP